VRFLGGKMVSPITAVTQLGQQVTSTLTEVRSEIGELKCEMKSLRDNGRKPMLAAAEAILKLQVEAINEDFDRQRDQEKREKFLEILLAWAISTVRQQKQHLVAEFKDAELFRKQSASQLESLIAFATAAIQTQVLFVKNLS
jgi:hypothetical protein